MAKWYGTARSNYFEVKDEAAFREWVASRNLGCLEELDYLKLNRKAPIFAIYANNYRWPNVYKETGERCDIVSELSQHLPKGQIAVLMSSGVEEGRFFLGEAIAVNHRGQVVELDFQDIYRMASKQFRVPQYQIQRVHY